MRKCLAPQVALHLCLPKNEVLRFKFASSEITIHPLIVTFHRQIMAQYRGMKNVGFLSV